MKKIIFSLLMALACSATFAAEWQSPKVSKFLKVENNSIGYLYNVATGKFLTNGNDYNTTATLANEGLEVKLEDCSAENGVESAWKVRFSVNNGLLFVFFGGVFYDGETKPDNIGHTLWVMTEGENGAIRLSMPADDPDYGYDPEEGVPYFGWGGEIFPDGSLSHTKCVYNIYPYEWEGLNCGVDWQLVSSEEYEIYKARTELFNTLNESAAAGINTDAAGAVYDNADATIEQINAAIQSQKALYNITSLEGATVDNPIDATFLIKDAICETGQGWNCDFTPTLHPGYHANGEAVLDKFIERWIDANNGTLPASDMTQVLYSLPAGRYRVMVDAIACNQKTGEPVNGVTFYVAYGDNKIVRDMNTANDLPECYVIDFVLDATADVTIGTAVADGSNVNWLGVDNFKMTYYGLDDNPFLSALNEKIDELEGYKADITTCWYTAETQKAWEELLARATAAKAGDDESMQAVTAEIESFIKSLKAEIEAYKQLLAFIEKVENASNEYADFPTVGGMLSDLNLELSDAYNEGTFPVDEIATLDAKYDAIINEGLRSDLKPGADITALINNPDFLNNNASGWEGTWPAVDWDVAEVWNAGLDIHQTLKNMRAGQYTLTFNGFHRHGGNEQYQSHLDGTEVHAIVYGNEQQTNMASIFDGMSEYPMSDAASITIADGTERFLPNSRRGFNEVQGNYPNTLKIIVKNDGDDLTFGIKTTGSVPENTWTTFDTFRLTYDGVDVDSYIANLKDASAALVAERDKNLADGPLAQDINSGIETVAADVAALESTVGSMAENEAVEAINKTFAAISDLNNTMAVFVQELANYKSMLSYYEVAGASSIIPEAYSTSEKNVNAANECPWANTEAMTTEFVVFRAAWAEALAAKGNDLSEAIINRGFTQTDNSGNTFDSRFGWTNGEGALGTTRVSSQEYWNVDKFNIYQEVVGLKPGYYSLTVTGFYRAGEVTVAADAYTAGTEARNAMLYAIVENDTVASPLMSPFDGAPTVSSGSNELLAPVNGVDTYTPNSMETFQEYVAMGLYTPATNEYNTAIFQIKEAGQNVVIGVRKDVFVPTDWTIFDTFSLTYLGEKIDETAIENVTSNAKARVEYYNVNGIRLAAPQRGVNIIRSTNEDGTVSTSKVIIK